MIKENIPKPPVPPPPPPDIWANVEVKPIIDYLQRAYQRSISETQQATTSINRFEIVAAQGGVLDVGSITSKQTINTSIKSSIQISEETIKDLQLNIPPMFVKLLVPGDTKNLNDLQTRVQVAVRNIITQENIQKIYQSSFDINKFQLIVRGRLTIDGDLSSDQTITTKIIAINTIKSIIDQSGVLTIVTAEPPEPKKGLDVVALIGAVLSGLCCLILFLLLILYGWRSKRGTK